MEILDVINIINESYEELYKEYRMPFLYDSAELTFTNGYCYEFFVMFKRFYPQAKLMMKKDKMHCLASIDGVLYDTLGIREENEDYREATGADIEYIYKYYGYFDDCIKENFNKIVLHNISLNSKASEKKLNMTAKV